MKLSRHTLGGLSVLQYDPPPARARAASVLLTHGLTASAAGVDPLSAYLSAHGFPVVAVDLPGHSLGASGGRLDSARQAVDALHDVMQAMTAPVIVGGHSYGAACSVLTALESQAVGLFVVALSPYGRRRFTSAGGRMMRDQRSGYVDGAALDDLLADMHARLAAPLDGLHDRPALVVGARQDLLVSPDDVSRWTERLPQAQVAFVDASHQDAPNVARVVISRWLEERFSE